MTTKGYAIGQVVYVISSSENRVVPLQVVEEVVRKTIEGEEVSYTVRVDSETTQPLPRNAEVFETIDVVREALIKRATVAIDGMMSAAMQRAELVFGHKEIRASKRSPTQPRKQPEKVETFVELPDGTKAKVNLPDGFQ